MCAAASPAPRRRRDTARWRGGATLSLLDLTGSLVDFHAGGRTEAEGAAARGEQRRDVIEKILTKYLAYCEVGTSCSCRSRPLVVLPVIALLVGHHTGEIKLGARRVGSMAWALIRTHWFIPRVAAMRAVCWVHGIARPPANFYRNI